jgi:hypothetical protein
VVFGDTGGKRTLFPDDDPWILLSEPIALGRAAAAPDPGDQAAARLGLLASIDVQLDEGEQRLRQAHFGAALEAAVRARRRLDRMRDGEDLRQRWVRLEVLSATAQLALGDERAARASLARAIEAQPDLVLDPMKTPPKVMRALELTRVSGEGSR